MPHKDPIAGREYRRKYYAKRRAIDLGYAKRCNNKWRDTNPKGYMLSRARSRAKVANVPFDLTTNDFDIPEYCPIFPNLKLEFSYGKERPDNCPSLDRIEPSKGYVKGNVAVISMRANRIKSDGTLEELEAIVKYLKAAKSLTGESFELQLP